MEEFSGQWMCALIDGVYGVSWLCGLRVCGGGRFVDERGIISRLGSF